MDLDDFGTHSFFLLELHGGKEEVVEEPPLLGIEVVEGLQDGRVVKAQITQPLADMSPVFLFDVGIVIFSVGARAGEPDGASTILEELDEMPVEELGPVVTIEAQQWEGQRDFDVLDLLRDSGLPSAPDSALLGPLAGNIDGIEGRDEFSGHRVAAMGHGIGFEEAWARFIPLRSLDGDLVFEDQAWLGCGQTPSAAQPHRFQDAINGGWGDLPKSLEYLWGQRVELDLIGWDPEWQDSLQALGAGEVGCFPDGLEGF